MRTSDSALFFVNLQAQATLDEPTNTVHDALSSALRLNINVAVISVSAELMTARNKKLVGLALFGLRAT